MKLSWRQNINDKNKNTFNVRLVRDTASDKFIGWLIFNGNKVIFRQSGYQKIEDIDLAELNAIVEEIRKHRNLNTTDDISDHEGGWKQGWANTDSMK